MKQAIRDALVLLESAICRMDDADTAYGEARDALTLLENIDLSSEPKPTMTWFFPKGWNLIECQNALSAQFDDLFQRWTFADEDGNQWKGEFIL